MLCTIVVSAILAVLLFLCIRYMVNNVKNGRSIDGCDGDCAHCADRHKHQKNN